MPNSPRNPNEEFIQGPRIPQAQRWDVDVIAEDSENLGGPKGLGHMMPSREKFAEACSARGIKPSDHVVFYDSIGIFSSPRGWYTFKAMGHDKVSVLDGGLQRYMTELLGDGAERGKPEMTVEKSEYPIPKSDNNAVRSYEQIVQNSGNPIEADDSEIVFDARSYERWTGDSPEPRPSLSSGHIPHSLSLPFTSLISPPSPPSKTWSTYLPLPDLKQAILVGLAGKPPSSTLSEEEQSIAENKWEDIKSGRKGVVWSCGSGMTACVGVLAMRIVADAEGDMLDKVSIYDESWTGYAMRPESKIIKGDK